MRVRLLGWVVWAMLASTGCGACDGPATPLALLDHVPGEAELVVLVDLPRVVDQMRRVSPYAAFAGRWGDLVDDLEGYAETHFGIDLLSAHTLAFWQAEGAWGATLRGDFDGELAGETVDVQGTQAVRLASDTFLARSGHYLVLGNTEGLGRGLALAAGATPNLAASAEHSAQLLRGLLEDQSGSLVSAAGLGPGLTDELAALGLDVRAVGVCWEDGSWLARARLPDADSAQAALTQIQGLVSQGLDVVRAAAADARGGPPEEALAAIVAAHTADLFSEEMLDLDVDGDTLVAELDLSSLESGATLIAALAGVSIQNYFSYIRQAQSAEASVELRGLGEAAASYFEAVYDSRGQPLPAQFPASAPRTPAAVPCGDADASDPTLWEHPTWQALGFAPQGPLRYSYQFDAAGTDDGARFTASAFGDLDCDGALSTFQYSGVARGGVVQLPAAVNSSDEQE